jgi:dihydrofolate reductase
MTHLGAVGAADESSRRRRPNRVGFNLEETSIDGKQRHSLMRLLTADLFITLDGYAKGARSAAYFGLLGPDLNHWIERELGKPQTIVMGRVTYEALAKYDDGSGPLVKMPNSALKQEPGPPLRIMGSVSLVQRLLRAGALDRLRLVVFPLLLGENGSEPIFANLPYLGLELCATEVLDRRLVVIEYRPVR